jgi:Spy/CpxP family protein refolding chaperone
MIIPKLGLMIWLGAAIGLAQQPGPVPPQAKLPAIQAVPPDNFAEPELRRFEELMTRRGRGEAISPEEQRFVREFLTRMTRMLRPAISGQNAQQAVQQALRMRANQAPIISGAARPAQPARPPLERAIGVPGGKWWTRPEMVQKLSLTADQTKKMDETFQQFRLKLIDLNAALQKEEAIMEPLIGVDPPDETKIVAQIDKVAQARTELEKSNARMLLGIRRLLTSDQWNKLKAGAPEAGAPAPPQPARR